MGGLQHLKRFYRVSYNIHLELESFLKWDLTTNGTDYRFVLLPQETPTYQQMPLLNLMDASSAIQLLQVLKGICKLQIAPVL